MRKWLISVGAVLTPLVQAYFPAIQGFVCNHSTWATTIAAAAVITAHLVQSPLSPPSIPQSK